jgi:hypothetical protein
MVEGIRLATQIALEPQRQPCRASPDEAGALGSSVSRIAPARAAGVVA